MKYNNTVDDAIEALLDEASLAPKPGLVSPDDSGSHIDMDYHLFVQSAHSLRDSFSAYLSCGLNHSGSEPSLLESIRPLGIQAELKMFETTNNVNTHKGANFLFGIILAAIGYGNYPSLPALMNHIQHMTKGIVRKELHDISHPTTFGETVYKKYGIAGIRGEVESGFNTIITYCLPLMEQENKPYQERLKEVLIQLIKINNDTNMIKRGGLWGLSFGKTLAAHPATDIDQKLSSMNQLFKIYNLSPGGSADLLAVTAFLYKYHCNRNKDKRC